MGERTYSSAIDRAAADREAIVLADDRRCPVIVHARGVRYRFATPAQAEGFARKTWPAVMP